MPLHSARRYRLLIGTVAMLAMLWLVLAPAVSRVQAAADPLAWVPVCTAGGLAQALSQPDGTPMPNPADRGRPVDGLGCWSQQTTFLLPAAELALTFPAADGAPGPVASGAPLRLAPSRARAQARAPPLG